MKKYLFFAGLACVAFGFVGCGSDDDGGSSKTPITLTEGSTAEESVFVTLTDGGKEEFLSYVEEEEKEGKDAKDVLTTLIPREVDASSDGRVMVRLNDEVVTDEGKGTSMSFSELASREMQVKTRAYEPQSKMDFEYLYGSYTYADGTYTIPNYGTMKLGSSMSTFNIMGKKEFKILTKYVQKLAKAGNNTTYLCRTWGVKKVNVEATVPNSKTTIGKEWTGSNLSTIVTDLVKQGLDMSASDLMAFEKLGSIDFITFGHNNRISIVFSGTGKGVYAGTWSWTDLGKGKLTYQFDDNRGNKIIPNKANDVKVNFDENVYTLDINTSYNYNGGTYKVHAIFTLTPKKN